MQFFFFFSNFANNNCNPKRTWVSWVVTQKVKHLSFSLSQFDEERPGFSCVVELWFCNLQKKQQQSCVGGTSDFIAHFSLILTVFNMLLTYLIEQNFIFHSRITNFFIKWVTRTEHIPVFNKGLSIMFSTFLKDVIHSTARSSILFKRPWWSVTWWVEHCVKDRSVWNFMKADLFYCCRFCQQLLSVRVKMKHLCDLTFLKGHTIGECNQCFIMFSVKQLQ